jgi:putative ABC transport system permease protein
MMMLGLLEIRRRKLQFSLIGLIVALITYLVLMVNGLGVGLSELSGRALKNFDADAIAYSETSNLSVIRSELGAETAAAAGQVPGVTASTPLGYFAVNIRKADGEVSSKAKSAALIGFDPGSIGEPPVTAGRPLQASDGDAILADKTFLKATDLKVGDSVTLAYRLTSSSFRIVGEVDQGAFFFQPTVFVLRSTWQQMRYGAAGEDQPAASIVLLQGKGLAGQTGTGFEVVSKSTAFRNIEGVSAQQSTVDALMFFGYLIGALVIGVFFYVLTLQKVAQIGVLKAVGASSGYVVRQIMVQVLALALAGVVVAVPVAWATNAALQQLPAQVPIAFTVSTFVVSSLAMLATALIGALFSARQAIKVDPIIALGQQQ